MPKRTGKQHRRRMNKVWHTFGKKGEDAVVDYLSNKEGVRHASGRNYNGMRPNQIADYERQHGDIDVLMDNGEIVKVEVKTDDICQFTSNIQFEMMTDSSPDPLSHKNKPGWWHPSKNTTYSVLVFVLVNRQSVCIENVNEARKWCFKNKELFSQNFNSDEVRKAERKETINWRINVDEFVEKCPFAKFVDIDTTDIDKYVRRTQMLMRRRSIYRSHTED